MSEFISTREVCRRLELSEPALRHVLRRQGAPRAPVHRSARLYLWTESDVEKLRAFIEHACGSTDHKGVSDAS